MFSSSSLEQMHPFGMPRPMPAGHRPWKPNVEIAPNCPRCDSSNTKFCYYNNYSLTQPRYFCKGCRRYWTKGGSLRNVPVGGGCRKNRRGKSAGARLSSGRATTISTTSSSCTDKYYSRLHTSSSSSSGAAALRPDLALDDMVGSSHQPLVSLPDDDQSSSRDASSIDLAALYSKFLNHCPEYAAEQGQFVAAELAEGPCGESYELRGGSEGMMGDHLSYDPFDVACTSGYESSLGMPDQSISPAEAFPALSSWQAPDHLQPGLCPFPGMGCDWSSLDQSSFGAF